MWKSIVALLVSVLSCSSCAKTYRIPTVEQDSAFLGIASHLLQADTVRVVFVHGMCSHDEATWITGGWDPVIKDVLHAQFRAEARRAALADSAFTVIDRSYTVKGAKTLSAGFILWSPATTGLKSDALGYDKLKKDGGEFPLRRAKVNSAVKDDLINDCFADAVIYSGHRGPELKRRMQDAICSAVQGCAPTTPIVLVTESLGSKMVLDALMGMQRAPADQVLEETRQIFMLANQLPLLGLAVEAGSNAADAMRQLSVDFAVRWKEASVRPGLDGDPRRLSVVAFTDPNDLLSYRLRDTDFPDISTTNVLGSNSGTFAGLIANPGTAHTGYEHNKRVMTLILCGHKQSHCADLRKQ